MTDQNEKTAARLDSRTAAAYLGVSLSFVNKSRLSGWGPPYLKLGARVVYDRDDLDKWLSQRRRRSTSDHQARAA